MTKDHPVITVIGLVFIRLTALAASYLLLLPSSWEPSKVVRCYVPLSGSLRVLRKHWRMGSIPQGSQWSSGPALCGTFNIHTSLFASSPPPGSITKHRAVTLRDRAVTGSFVLFHSTEHVLRSQYLTVGMGCPCWADAACPTGWDGRRESSRRPVGGPTDALAVPWELMIDTP